MSRQPDPGLVSTSQPNPALAQWAARALHPITLPTGARVKVRVPPPEAMLDQLPSDLRRLALEFSTTGVDLSSADDETLEQMIRFMNHIVCQTLREVWDEESQAWELVHLTVELLREMEFPEEDLTALQLIGSRKRDPKQVDATSLAALGQLDPAEADRIVGEEAGGTQEAFAPFREQPGGSADGADGQPLPLQPGADVPRRKRSGARAHDRRRAVSEAAGVGDG